MTTANLEIKETSRAQSYALLPLNKLEEHKEKEIPRVRPRRSIRKGLSCTNTGKRKFIVYDHERRNTSLSFNIVCEDTTRQKCRSKLI